MTNIDADLNHAYSAQGTVTPESFAATMARYRQQSEAATDGLTAHLDIVYGHGQRLDVLAPGSATEPRPVVLAIHGGYWRMLSRKDTAFMARTLDDVGIATVAVDYALAPEATIEEMITQVRAAVAWVHREGPARGLDPTRLVVLGSSAGAHLAASTLEAGWASSAGLSEPAVAGGMLISGLFDLRPLTRTFAQDWLQLTDERAALASPALRAPITVPVVVARAENEASGFHEQSRSLMRRWGGGGGSTHLHEVVVPARDHFDVFLDLADPTSQLSQLLVDLAVGPGTR